MKSRPGEMRIKRCSRVLGWSSGRSGHGRLLLCGSSGAASNRSTWIHDLLTELRPSSPDFLPVTRATCRQRLSGNSERSSSQRRAERPALVVCGSPERSCRTFGPRGSGDVERNVPGAARQLEAVAVWTKPSPVFNPPNLSKAAALWNGLSPREPVRRDISSTREL